MDPFKEEVFKFARNKAIREQRNMVVFNRTDGYFLVQPQEYELVGDPIKTFRVNDFTEQEINQIAEPIDDYSSLEEGQHVLISNQNIDQITRVSDRQIVCRSGLKFRKSDGKEWGDERLRIVKRIKK